MGQPTLGILMLDTRFPRIPGDVGNEQTFPFPVRKLMVEGADPRRVVLEGDSALLEPFVQGARLLEQEGVSAITTSCGFLAMFQRELAHQVQIPVFTSSLLQVPMVARALPQGSSVGILTADSRSLTPRHFAGAGMEQVHKVVYGMEHTHFHDVFVGNSTKLDREQARRDILWAARAMVKENPQVKAIVMECTNMPPYAHSVARELGLPVYDITTLANYVMSGLARTAWN